MMVSDTVLLGALCLGCPVQHLGNHSGDCFDSLGAIKDSPFGRPGDIIIASNRSSDSDEGLLKLRFGKVPH